MILICRDSVGSHVRSSSPDKVPHFSRLGDVEVNAGQNASFQCVATGKVSETEPFLLEVRTRRLLGRLCPRGDTDEGGGSAAAALECCPRGTAPFH